MALLQKERDERADEVAKITGNKKYSNITLAKQKLHF